MELPTVDPEEYGVETPDGLAAVGSYVPVTVVAIALVCWALAAGGLRFDTFVVRHPLNPLVYVANMVFHLSWSHFAGNMWYWIPFGILLTWLTGNRHVLVVVLVAQVLASAMGLAIGEYPVGLSGAVLAVAAAVLVRATGAAFQNASTETLQTVVIGVFGPLVAGFMFVAALAGGGGWIAHFGHFFGFFFGGTVEMLYVFHEYGEE